MISVGGYTTCAVAAGKAYCWGLNEFGELGNNTVVNKTAPVAVDITGALAGKVITAISTAAQLTGNTLHPAFGHTCAVAGGAPVCWGANQYGQLGATTTRTRARFRSPSAPLTHSWAGPSPMFRRRGFQPGGDVPARGPEHAGAFVSLAPARILDTRTGLGATGPVAAQGTVTLQVTGNGGVPATGAPRWRSTSRPSPPDTAGFITV